MHSYINYHKGHENMFGKPIAQLELLFFRVSFIIPVDIIAARITLLITLCLVLINSLNNVTWGIRTTFSLKLNVSYIFSVLLWKRWKKSHHDPMTTSKRETSTVDSMNIQGNRYLSETQEVKNSSSLSWSLWQSGRKRREKFIIAKKRIRSVSFTRISYAHAL